MLKISYLDSELRLEPLSGTLEALVAQHSILSLRLGQPVMIQPSRGSIPIPAALPGVDRLMTQSQRLATLEVAYCDSHWLEITFHGVWIADNASCDQGIFVTECDRALEQQILHLWQLAQPQLMPGRSRHLPNVC